MRDCLRIGKKIAKFRVAFSFSNWEVGRRGWGGERLLGLGMFQGLGNLGVCLPGNGMRSWGDADLGQGG